MIHGMLGQFGIWLGIVSGVTMLLGIGGGLAALVLIPANYFAREKKSKRTSKSKSKNAHGGSLAWRIGKNVAGVALLLLGIVLTLPLVPGPGIVFLLLGLSLVDIPGKKRLERYLISRPFVLRPINALRARFHRPALVAK